MKDMTVILYHARRGNVKRVARDRKKTWQVPFYYHGIISVIPSASITATAAVSDSRSAVCLYVLAELKIRM
jgi:hypothetical protein